MKKILVYIFIFSMFIYSVIAANVYEAKDFTDNPEQLIRLEERDAVKLNWDDKEHKLMVRKIYLDKKKVDLTAFITGAEVPFYVTITFKASLQLDFDQDLEYDLKVSLLKILEEEKIVALKLEKLKKEPQATTTGAVIELEPENNISPNIFANKFYILIGLFILILVIWKRRTFLKTYKKLKKTK